MPTSHDPLGNDQDGQSNIPADVQEINADFRRDLAFQSFTDEMVQRLRGYGQEEIVPENGTLYTHGDRDSDMFVVLDGEIEVVLRSLNGGYKVFAHHRRHQFSGELSLLNSQTAVTEASALEVFVGLRGVRREKLILQGLAYRMGLGGPVDERGYFVNHPPRPAVPNLSPFLAPRWPDVRLADYTSSGSERHLRERHCAKVRLTDDPGPMVHTLCLSVRYSVLNGGRERCKHAEASSPLTEP